MQYNYSAASPCGISRESHKSPTSFTSSGKESRGGGYSSLGVQLMPSGGGGVGSSSRRRKKMDYVGLDDIEDSISEPPVRGVAEGAGAAAAAAAGAAVQVSEDEEDDDDDKVSGKLAIFGLLNLLYVVLQLVGAMAFNSLALLSDGFHNLSDVAVIGMALHIHRLQRKRCPENSFGGTDELPHGYKRAEVIGGLVNSIALIALSVYVALSAIPKLFQAEEVKSGWPYMLLAFGGVLVNLVGVLFFMYSGEDAQDHGGFLSAHNHSHDHGHELSEKIDSMGLLTIVDPNDASPTPVNSSEGDDDEEVSVIFAGPNPMRCMSTADSSVAGDAFSPNNGGGVADEEEGGWVGGDHGGVVHDHGREEDDNASSLHSNSLCHHSNEHSHGHSHGHEHEVHVNEGVEFSSSPCSRATLPQGSGGRGEGFGVGQSRSGCSHDSSGDRCSRSTVHACNGHGQSHGHDHGHGVKSDVAEDQLRKGFHVKHGKHAAVGCPDAGHDHAHGHHVHGHHGSCDGGGGGSGGGCSHTQKHGHGSGGCTGHGHGDKSMNVMAVLVHAMADAVSSAVVCAQGAVAFFFGKAGVDWTDKLDPLTSIVLSVVVIYFALPVVKVCSHVLLEGTPRNADLPRLRKQLLEIRGVSSIHALSVTQLNSKEPYVASVTLIGDGSVGDGSAIEKGRFKKEEGFDEGEGGEQEGRVRGVPSVGMATVIESVKRVLAGHNIGRNTVELVLPSSSDMPRGGSFDVAGLASGSGLDQPPILSTINVDSGHGSGGKRHDGCGGDGGSHEHGHDRGHSHGHAASVDLV